MLAAILGHPAAQLLLPVAYAAFGWWLKHRTVVPATIQSVVPAAHAPTVVDLIDSAASDPGIVDAVQLLLDRVAHQKQAAAHATLQTLSAPVPQVVAAPVVVPAK